MEPDLDGAGDRFGPFVEEPWIILMAARGIAQLENLLTASAAVDEARHDLPERPHGPAAE
jgi:hypothetical protein